MFTLWILTQVKWEEHHTKTFCTTVIVSEVQYTKKDFLPPAELLCWGELRCEHRLAKIDKFFLP